MKGIVFCILLWCLSTPAFAAQTWAVYWYICGSDLERQHGAASADIAEVLKSRLPDNVKVVMQTGGARQWQKFDISAKHIGRYVYHNGKFTQVERLPQASMGTRATLESFLRFCNDNYPADKKIFIFWDHGGGSVLGLCNDENYSMRGMSLHDVEKAFNAVFTRSEKSPPFELIGFDTCLMSSLETALSIQGMARYMVASQDVEPGCGWEYTGWLNALGANTATSGKELGKTICDAYLQGCREVNAADAATLSVIDINKINTLRLTFNALGLEAITKAVDNDGIYALIGRSANKAENYANSRSEGYSNMVDIGSMVRSLRKILPNFATSVLQALDEAVVYKVNGSYRSASGLSCYYPFDGDTDNYNVLKRNGKLTSFFIFNGLQLGVVDQNWAVAQLEAMSNEISAAVDTTKESQDALGGSSPATPSPPSHSSQLPPTDSSAANSPEQDTNGLEGFFNTLFGGQNGSVGDTNNTPPNSATEQNLNVGEIASNAVQQAHSAAQAGGQTGTHSGGQPEGQSTTQVSGLAGLSAMFDNILGQTNTSTPQLAQLFEQTVNTVLGVVRPLPQQDISSLEDFPVTITRDGKAQINLGFERADKLQKVEFHLLYYDIAEDIIIDLGKDADLEADWDTGAFRDNFRGSWPALNGNLLYTEVTETKENSTHYIMPVLLNGVRCNLIVVYDFTTERFNLLGARKKNAETFDKSLIKLKKGDKIVTIHYGMTIEGNDDSFTEVEVDSFTLGDTITIEDMDMGDGTFMYMFTMTDVQNQTANSQIVDITVKGDDMTLNVLE